MIDLTPLDVRKKRGDFRKLFRGYDPEEVDTFLELVAERLEDLVKENLTLTERALRFESQLRALEQRETAVQEALVTAQKLREDVRAQSRLEAEALRNEVARETELRRAEAQRETERHLREAEGQLHDWQRSLEDLKRSRVKFLKAFRSLLEREMDAVEVEEARQPLEDVPLELEFGRWTSGGMDSALESEAGAEPEAGGEAQEAPEADEAEASDVDGLALEVGDAILAAPEADLKAGTGAASSPDLETGELDPNERDALQANDAEASGFETNTFGDRPEATGDSPPTRPHRTPVDEGPEPKWLFSLLKKGGTAEPEEGS